MSIDPAAAATIAAERPSPPTPAQRRADAIALLAEAVIKTYIADHNACRVAAQRECSPSQKEGENALLERREEAVLSQPRGRAR